MAAAAFSARKLGTATPDDHEPPMAGPAALVDGVGSAGAALGEAVPTTGPEVLASGEAEPAAGPHATATAVAIARDVRVVALRVTAPQYLPDGELVQPADPETYAAAA